MTVSDVTAAMQAQAGNAPAFGHTLKFNFKGDGVIYLDGTGDQNVISNDDKEAECTLNISLEDFVALRNGELNPMMAFMSGKISLDGDMGIAMKLQSLLDA